ncbi:MAG: glycosyltransferase family 2 protein [Chloracidobacterium sp.]|nr:glycosyltransferase family 2 protein [Chloracidobacterium sp.]
MIENRRRNKNISKRIGSNVSDRLPRVSVIIPAYNSAAFIAETLDSAIKQRFRDHEIIVVNDGSPDTKEFEFAIGPHLENIIYIRQRNAGAGVARNTGIEHARGDIIAFLDADDAWMPDFLASQFVFLERNNYDMVYCDAMLFGMQSAYRRTFMETAPSTGDANFESILDLRCNVITSGTMARKKVIVEAGSFETERVRAHDFHLWLRMAKNGAKIGYQRKQLLKYRVHLESLSGDAISRAMRERDAFERVAKTIELTDEQHSIVKKRIEELEADLAVEQGKALLLNGNFREAEAAFRAANNYRKSSKLAVVSLLTRVAPHVLLKFYRSNRGSEIAFIEGQSN